VSNRNNENKVTERIISEKTFESKPDDDLIICRCEEITKGEIRRAVYDGMYTITEIRRYLRTGMGLCQGQTCSKLVLGILAKEIGISPSELGGAVPRAPVRPVLMKVFANEQNN
jgi:NAD(P)H-nitrite reductase large subunit